LKDAKEGPNAELIKEFLTILAVCHTVIPEVDETDETNGQMFFLSLSLVFVCSFFYIIERNILTLQYATCV
jgi:hypothetical protein